MNIRTELETACHSDQSLPCNLCSQKAYTPLYEINGFRIVRCSACRLVFVANPPPQSRLVDEYGPGYYQAGYELVYQDYLAEAERRREGFRHRIRDIQRYFPEPGSLLEIGSAYGLFLQVARQAGWSAKGVELSPHSSAYARQTLGMDVLTGDLSEQKIEQTFDLVVGWDVIEHLRDPLGTMKRVNAFLPISGMAIFSTGNYACLGARLYRAGWHLLAPPWHLYYFTELTLNRLMQASGFEVVEMRHGGNPFYNRPGAQKAGQVLTRVFCSRWMDRTVTRIAARLKQGLLLTVYAQKTGEVEP